MTQQHTPGPWRHRSLDFCGITDANGRSIVRILGGQNGEERAEARANARLVCAAPDLLDALTRLLEDTQHAEHSCIDESCPVSAARAAIAKALGEQASC